MKSSMFNLFFIVTLLGNILWIGFVVWVIVKVLQHFGVI